MLCFLPVSPVPPDRQLPLAEVAEGVPNKAGEGQVVQPDVGFLVKTWLALLGSVDGLGETAFLTLPAFRG